LSSWTSEENYQLLAREYRLDEDRRELVESRRCGEDTGHKASHGGEAHRLPGGNTLLNYGAGGSYREFDPDCATVWHLEFPERNLAGRSIFLEDLYAFAP